MSETPKWSNRIIGHDEVAPDQLLANPLNFRIHPSAQQSALSGSLDSLGWIQEVLVNQNTGHVIDGHLRIQLALRNDEKLVPVTYLDLTEDEERLALLSLDPIAAMAATDKEQLETLLSQVNSDDQRVQEFLSNLAKESGLTYGEQEQSDAEPQIDKAEELQKKWQVQTGDLYSIGSHKLLCGDSTKREDVERVMQGEKANCVLTDPPYALFGNSTGVSGIADDKMVRPFFREIAKMSMEFTKKFSHVYVCCDWHSAFVIQDVMQEAGLTAKNLCIWDKGDGGIGANYQQCYEMIWFFSNSPKAQGTLAHKESGEKTVNGVPNIWRFPRATTDRVHNAEKPVELFSVPIKHAVKEGEVVLDLFLGGGTTMVACQNLSRKCRAIEISPAYCAVILQRMTDAFPGIIIDKINSV